MTTALLCRRSAWDAPEQHVSKPVEPVVAPMTTAAISIDDAHASARVGGPVPSLPRTGRHRQRYAPGGERLVAGCIPVRVNGDGIQGVEVLLISSRAGKGFCFPKGGWEDDETVEMAAKRETLEEAGVRGELEEPILGMFPFKSGKQLAGEPPTAPHHGHGCIAHMYVLHVAEMLEVWPELERQRIWVPLVEAVQRCRAQWMREALLTWVRRKGWDLPAECLSFIIASSGSSEPLASPTASLILAQQQHLQEQLQQAAQQQQHGAVVQALLQPPQQQGAAAAGGAQPLLPQGPGGVAVESLLPSGSGTSSTTPAGGSPLGAGAGALARAAAEQAEEEGKAAAAAAAAAAAGALIA